VEAMHASCMRCLGLPKWELGEPTPCSKPHITSLQAPYHFNKSCFDVVIEEVTWL